MGIGDPSGGEAQVAEPTLAAGKTKRIATVRLVVRRTRLADPAQVALFPGWRHLHHPAPWLE